MGPLLVNLDNQCSQFPSDIKELGHIHFKILLSSTLYGTPSPAHVLAPLATSNSPDHGLRGTAPSQGKAPSRASSKAVNAGGDVVSRQR